MLIRTARHKTRTIYDDLRKLPLQTDTDKLEALAESILSLRLSDFSQLHKELKRLLPLEDVFEPIMPKDRSSFPHPLVYFK